MVHSVHSRKRCTDHLRLLTAMDRAGSYKRGHCQSEIIYVLFEPSSHCPLVSSMKIHFLFVASSIFTVALSNPLATGVVNTIIIIVCHYWFIVCSNWQQLLCEVGED